MNIVHPLDFRAIRALEAQNRRPGDVLKDGERLHFNVNLIDSANKAARSSIDETVKAAIEREAKLVNQKPADWLASADPRVIQRLIEGAARDHVAALGGEGIARGFALDSAVALEVGRAEAIHNRKFAFLGSKAPKFNRDNAEIVARNRLQNIASAAPDRSRLLAAGRHHDVAKAPSVLPGPVSGASLTGDAVTAAHNASMAKIRRARFTGE